MLCDFKHLGGTWTTELWLLVLNITSTHLLISNWLNGTERVLTFILVCLYFLTHDVKLNAGAFILQQYCHSEWKAWFLPNLFSLSSLNVKMPMTFVFYDLIFVFLFPSPNYPYRFSQRGAGSSSVEIKPRFYFICNEMWENTWPIHPFFGLQIRAVSLHQIKSDHNMLSFKHRFAFPSWNGSLALLSYSFCNSRSGTEAAASGHTLLEIKYKMSEKLLFLRGFEKFFAETCLP